MSLADSIWASPAAHLAAHPPAHPPARPVLYVSPAALQAGAAGFVAGFPGQVCYALKANPEPVVLDNLLAAGIDAFDVASPQEIAVVRRVAPGAALHYNNPVRGAEEIAAAVASGVASWSVDSGTELDKLAAAVPAGAEVAVRFKLPVAGAAYDFGAKFGAGPEAAAALLARVAALGHTPALAFHPGTQCTDPRAWSAYIAEAAAIARAAGVEIARLNVGGGFPSHRLHGAAPALDGFFGCIDTAVADAFGAARPGLVCEPGRALVADAFTLATTVKAVRDGAHVFLDDGIYGGLAETALIGMPDRIEVIAPDGARRTGPARPRTVFGPTCDSVDRLPGEVALPGDIAEGDRVLFHGLGAYSAATVTRFNGYGLLDIVTVLGLGA